METDLVIQPRVAMSVFKPLNIDTVTVFYHLLCGF